MVESACGCLPLHTHALTPDQLHEWHCWDKLVLGMKFADAHQQHVVLYSWQNVAVWRLAALPLQPAQLTQREAGVYAVLMHKAAVHLHPYKDWWHKVVQSATLRHAQLSS